MKKFVVFFVVVLPVLSFGQMGRGAQSLDGEWTFAMDPMKKGEDMRWPTAGFAYEHFDKVQVPHCFSVDPRYQFYTGTAWYFRKFIGNGGGLRQFLHFGAVYYRSKVFLNGEVVGEHEGGYTPFELEVTGRLKDQNYLAVEVDNGWDTTTIPGAKTQVGYQSDNMGFFFPWINYGGIIRHVQLVSRPADYVRQVKVISTPDLVRGTAKVKIVVTPSSSSDGSGAVNACIFKEGDGGRVACKSGLSSAVLVMDIPAKDLQLWDQDHPRLYRAVVTMGVDTFSTTFGIRRMQVQGTRLLLNGEPVRFGGANRPIDYPGFGSIDPPEVLEKDLGLMKSGCMELSRIIHYPVSEEFLDWADRHGLMIIEEAGNWQMTPKQMTDTSMRRRFEAQMREMVERDWNHPCIVAWSVGNEFQSQLPEGKSWVVDMSRFVRTMDTTRLITFASMMVAREIIKTPQDEASQYVDFISANMYGDYLKRLQHIHAVYPDKPVFVSEFGIRTDGVKNENGRIEHLRQAMEAFRQCDFLIGASVWTFNDYLSRFPGTNPNGYRPWGLVGPDRVPRGMYYEWQEQLAPATLELVGQGMIRITARKDFPSYVLRDYVVRCGGQTVSVPVLRPGESRDIQVTLPAGGAIELVKPGGFVILKKIFNR